MPWIDLYYAIKPMLPTNIRIAFRRWWANRILRASHHCWPILDNAGYSPHQWPGWPGQKQFAFVLTHDVEGPAGLSRCRQLMELEMELGFRSAFFFVPEGSYRVPPDLRRDLIDNGFEVGIHDLHHNGKLYISRRSFAGQAELINKYLREWGACGFRSAYMLHQLDWIHDLEIEYDASTFDTDPFEPQPEGVHTIFPFWVQGHPEKSGYCELPYTLTQDSTVFLILGNQDWGAWKTKLDWIKSRGGLALLNTHPDYMRFNGQRSLTTYDVQLYREFLESIRQNHRDDFWHPLPRTLSRFVKDHRNTLTRPIIQNRAYRRIAMVTHSVYQGDDRVMRYAESLAQRGDQVEVIALGRERKAPRQERINGVQVTNPHFRSHKNQNHPLSYLIPMLWFMARASSTLFFRQLTRRYDLIHVHNVPDFLVFSAWFPKLTGTRLILDIHDVLPEFYASKFKRPTDDWLIHWLRRLERWSMGFADHVIISNHLWHSKVIERSVVPKRCSVFINNVDPEIFFPRPRIRKDGQFLLIYPGGLQWHQGLDIGIRALALIEREFPQVEFHIYGEGNMKASLQELVEELGLQNRVRFFDPLPTREVAPLMAEADLGVVPKRADPFGNEAYSTKIMEFMALGVPVVVSKTRIDSFYFNDQVVQFFQSGDCHDLSQTIRSLILDEPGRNNLRKNALNYASKHNWESRREDYLNLVDRLIQNSGPVDPVV